MRKSQFDTIRSYLASFERIMQQHFNGLSARLGEIEKRVANPDTSPYVFSDESLRHIRIELSNLKRILDRIDNQTGMHHTKTRSLRDEILMLAEELEVD
jgi:hypothetical protein